MTGVLPEELQGSHFGITIKSYVIYQYYHQRVTQPLILQQLTEWGINISSGQISNILIKDKTCFHTEKDELLNAGINNSRFIHVDDTGSRHEGKNGYCTHIGNESFAWFSSTQSKSRINFLELLQGRAVEYTINSAALNYMRMQGLPQRPFTELKQYKQKQTPDLKATIKAHFDELCSTQISFATLNQALKRLACNKDELLLALERPDIPLHNNLSERDIREYVIKRKISGSTRSENGRRCRDTFASLKKTCNKQGLSFWEFLCDRLRKQNLVPYLPDLLSGNV
jgi:hypothetical protein